MVRIVLLQVADGLLKREESLHTECLIEGEVWLVRHTVRCGSIDDGLVEGEDGIVLLQDMLWYFLQVRVKTYAEKRLFLADLLC